MIRKTLKKVWIIFTFYLIMGSCISLHWVVRPVISAILFGEKTRIVDTWPPFIDTWPQFFFSFCYQLPMILGLGHAFYIFDNVYFCISECILCNLAVLQYRLNRMKLKTNQGKSEDLVHSIEYYSKILRWIPLYIVCVFIYYNKLQLSIIVEHAHIFGTPLLLWSFFNVLSPLLSFAVVSLLLQWWVTIINNLTTA